MYFQSLTRQCGIGANSYLLDLDGTRLILDAGMHPKEEGLESIPNYGQIQHDSVDGIVISHCHLDHIGSLPVAMRHHPSAPVFMTEACGELSDAMLHNSVNVMTLKREELQITDYPFFTHREIDRGQHVWQYRTTDRSFTIGEDNAATCQFYSAGHIMGSVGVQIDHQGKRVFYTGDVNFEDQTLALGATFPREPVDVLIMETTRGGVQRDPAYSRSSELDRVAHVIDTTIARGGSVLIPIFAMGKTQEMLMALHLMRKRNAIPAAPIFIGGLSTKMTLIYDRFASLGPRNHMDFEILKQVELTVASRKRKRDISYSPCCIYALSSGMMTEKTVSNHFAHEFLDNPKNSLLFVGYADPDSPAGKIRAAQKGDPIQLDPEKPTVDLNCDVHVFDFSGHAVREDLRKFAVDVNPKKIILVHGDEPAVEWFSKTLSADLPNTEIVAATPGEQTGL